MIDFHIHPLHYEYYGESALEWIKNLHKEKYWEEYCDYYNDPDNFIDYLRKSGVDYGVVLAELCPAVTGVCSNEYVLQFCKGHKELIPFASINLHLTVNPALELKRLLGEGFKGLKLYPTYQHLFPNDHRLYPIYAVAEQAKIPVMFHTGSSIFKGARLKYGDPLYLDDVAVDFPNMNIILVHGGRGFWYERAFFLTRLHENVYLEIAGLPPQKLIDYYPELDRIGDKVLFGSDWPGITDLQDNIDTIRKLPLPAEQIEDILGGNAAKLLGEALYSQE